MGRRRGQAREPSSTSASSSATATTRSRSSAARTSRASGCSNVLTKLLQRPRLGAYLEQSTRYIAYDAPMPTGGGYRYYRDDELGPEYAVAMDALFDAYAQALPRVTAWVAQAVPAAPRASPRRADARAIKAKALDLLRGLLPASSLSHMGIFATGQTYEQLILHLLAHPLPEAREYGRMILARGRRRDAELRRARGAARPRRRVGRLPRGARARRRPLGRPPGARPRRRVRRRARGPSVRLLHVDGDEEDRCSPRCSSRRAGSPSSDAAGRRVARLSTSAARDAVARTSSATAANRRHRPGRGFEALRYRFEIVSDYGAFRDLQRHRMLTGPVAGADPRPRRRACPRRSRRPGSGDAYRGALERLARRVRAAGRRRASSAPRPTRCASATASATCSTSTRARRCS